MSAPASSRLDAAAAARPGLAAASRVGRADVTLVAAAVASGLLAGVFFAYSVSVMPALHRADDATFVHVMQDVNEVIQNPVFFLVLFGAPLLAAVAVVQQRRGPAGRAAALGLGLLVLGLVVTSAVNVPLNDALARAGDHTDLHAARSHFETRWDVANAVRTVVHLGAAAALTRAALVTGRARRAR